MLDTPARETRTTSQLRERGQSVPVVAVLLWLMAAVSILMGSLGERAVRGARAQAGADAVALAAAGGGSAETIAGANGVQIQRLDRSPDVDVVVADGSVSAAARARPARPELEGLDARLIEAIARTEAVLGDRLVIVSGFRTRADQERLWLMRDTNPYPVAPPGTSLHEAGLAIDLALHQVSSLVPWSAQLGLCQPLPATDPVHFVLC